VHIIDFIANYEMSIRLAFFFGVIGIIAIWEIISPRRHLNVSKAVRWLNNLGLVALNTVILRFIFPATAVGMAAFAETQNWGLFNYFDLPFWLTLIASIVIMDAAIYIQHVLMHAVPILWRLHRVHHADLDFDVTTGSRFHPIEIVLSMLAKFVVIIVVGPPIVAIIIFEVLLNASSMFNHGNIRILEKIDCVLRLFIVTPDMHRIHHSIEDDEMNSNFGFCLSWWDRLFGTYRNQPRVDHKVMVVGINTLRDNKYCTWLPGMLLLPFVGKVTR